MVELTTEVEVVVFTALMSLEEVTREHVLRVLERHHGNATAAARQLGLSRTTLWRMLKRWGADRAAVGGRER